MLVVFWNLLADKCSLEKSETSEPNSTALEFQYFYLKANHVSSNPPELYEDSRRMVPCAQNGVDRIEKYHVVKNPPTPNLSQLQPFFVNKFQQMKKNFENLSLRLTSVSWTCHFARRAIPFLTSKKHHLAEKCHKAKKRPLAKKI